MHGYPLACLLPPRSLAAVVAAYPEVMAGLARDDEQAPLVRCDPVPLPRREAARLMAERRSALVAMR